MSQDESELNMAGIGADFYSVDFTGADKVPNGELLLEIAAIKPALSSNKNKMLNLQLKVVEGEFANRMVFDRVMLEPADARWRLRLLLKAFTGEAPNGPITIDPGELIGQQAWCLVTIEPGNDKFPDPRPAVQKYGIKAPAKTSGSSF